MPYIPGESRPHYDKAIDALIHAMHAGAGLQPGEPGCLDEGALTYIFARVGEGFRSAFGDSYRTFDHIRGSFTDAHDEFYRRVCAPYEDAKCRINGDVYAPLDPALLAQAALADGGA